MIHRTLSPAVSLAGLVLLAGCFHGDASNESVSTGGESTTGGSGGASSAGDTSGVATSGVDTSGGASSGGSTSGEASSSGGGGVCGDGNVDPGEECDDANADDTDACPSTCASAFCGDGFVQAGVETCDDGDGVDGNGCDNDCTPSIDPQCNLPYNSFDRADRSYTYNDGDNGIEYTDTTGDSLVGPDWLGAGWYRFTGAAGQFMPEFPLSTYACGTDAAGWLNGVHPGVDDGIVEREVCFSFIDDTCAFSTNVNVVDCGDFYLYELPEAPASALRYCGSDVLHVDPQCALPYTSFSAGDRNASFNDGSGGLQYTDTTGTFDVAPDWSGPGWYRFTAGSGVVMPEYAPDAYACATDAPGWLAGAHPTVAAGVVARTACFDWVGTPCAFSVGIEVVDCGSFYLYNLPDTPTTTLRYCGSDRIGDPACGNPYYGTLTEADRNVGFNDGSGGVEYSDIAQSVYQSPDWDGPGWYRILGDAGTQLPESPPADFSCGADAPGWLSSPHPTIADGPVAATACFSYLGDTCMWSTPIQVVDCGAYYLYDLPDAPGNVMRYCGE